MLDQITPLIITYNEAPNIERTLKKLVWAKRILLIDSGSTDDTLALARRHPQVDVVEHSFSDFASQCNFGLGQIATPWVLSLDADYELSDELVGELETLAPSAEVVGYSARFVYRIHGRPLRGTLYPPRMVLYRKHLAAYRNEGHGHRVTIAGEVRDLRGVIYHDDRKPFSRWFASQQRYAREEASWLLGAPRAELSRMDRIRRMAWPAPFGVFIYVLLLKGCALDGRAGWTYALQRTIAEALIAIEVLKARLRVFH